MKHSIYRPRPLHSYLPNAKQGGYATLSIGLVMLVMISLITIFATRSGILDLRTSANRVRAAEAQAAAEGRLEKGIAFITFNRGNLDPTAASWSSCSATVSPPCGDFNTNRYGSTYKYRCLFDLNNDGDCVDAGEEGFAYVVAPAAGGFVYDLVTEGQSADGTARAVAKQGIYFYSFGDGQLPAPFTAAGNVHLNGTFNIVANPNGAGSGLPVSVWTPQAVDIGTGTPKTCHLHEYQAGSGCPNDSTQLSGTTNGKGMDIVESAPTPPFPTDMFDYVFGVPTANYASIKSQAINLPNCSSLNSSSRGIYWVTGDCQASGNIGSPSNPVILVVQPGNGQSGEIRLNGGEQFYGIMFAFDPAGNPGDVNLNGGAKVHGTVLTNDTTVAGQTINGTFDLVYNSNLLLSVSNSPATRGIAKIPGSWSDYLCNSGTCN